MRSDAELTRRQFVGLGCACGLLSFSSFGFAAEDAAVQADVCVYGGTASGVMAAVAAAREGCRVVIVEPSRWLGGMTGGGISVIDWGRKEAVGGSTLGILNQGYDDARYRKVFAELVSRHGIAVLFEHRLNEVRRDGNSIQSITLDFAPPDDSGCPIPEAKERNAAVVTANVFIDCSYEGDLMARSGVSHTFGRESQDRYGESLAGVRPHIWTYDIDPYLTPGDPQSGLIPLLQDRAPAPLGAADKLTMGYCFRFNFDLTGAGIPILPADNYDPHQFELFRRGFTKGLDLLRGRKMSTLGVFDESEGVLFKKKQGNTNRSLLTTTVFGCNADYPDGDWATRSKIWKFHQDYFRNLVHFLQTDPSVPEKLRDQAKSVTLQRGLYDDTNGWPHQLYVREARRMISAYVLKQADLEGKTDPEHSIGLASYGVDDWPYATVADNGKVALSGGEFSQLYLDDVHQGIYKIPYEAITPLQDECDNLLVPVCCSASHIAMTSVRMEPVWMILGESAGVAAAIASRRRKPVQDVSYRKLRARLLDLGQRLDRP
ncbi:MAG: FAD-dependent oxidoreductase [FCB group bacterium]|jgi:hypothetical protein|nr:FAD-dependent oxidoreductase [FCB group bacterium]